MSRKVVSDYVHEITKEVNAQYKQQGLDIIFTEKEVERIINYNLRNIATCIKSHNDVHIRGFFKIFSAKRQLIKYNFFHPVKKKTSWQEYKEFFHLK